MRCKLMFLIFIIFLYSIAAVCAIDDNEEGLSVNTEEIYNNYSSISEDENDFILSENNNALLNDDNATYLGAGDMEDMDSTDLSNYNENPLHSFEYLNDKISSTYGTLDLENDFAFNESIDVNYTDGIGIFNDNIIINGNNHIIDAKNQAKIFNITANNITLANIQFKNAFAREKGAALYITGNYVKIINCSFIDNNADIEAAAMYLVGNDAFIDNCTFINNSAQYTGAILIRSHNGCINNSYFENNTADISAGAIGLAFRNNTSIQNCVFINNGAYNEGGAAIFVNQALNTTIINSIFMDNYADYNGGGIFWSYGHGGSVINSTFINNTATEKGGAIYHIGDDITLTDNIFNSNNALTDLAIYLNTGNNKKLLNNILVSSSIYMNNINNSIISDSIILDKMICENSTVLFKNNWFGNTKNNYNESLNEYADNWLYLNASANETSIGQDVLVKFYFDQFNNSQPFNLPEIILDLNPNNLILDEDNVLIDNAVNSHITDYGAYINASYENVIFEYEIPISDINIFANNLTKYYGDSQSFIVNVFNSKSNPVSNKTADILIHGVKYSRITDENGTAALAINLHPGIYDISVCVENMSVYYTVTVMPTIDADDLVKVFKNESQYCAIFKDSKGNLLKNTDVSFNVNGITYIRTTDNDGIAMLNINLNAGNYIITDINPVTGEIHSNNITVLSRFGENSDLIKYYRNDSQYIVKIIGDDGNPAGAGEVVTFNINGVFYNRTTDESGYAKLNINLDPGNYIITAQYNGCMVSNNINVKPVLSASDLIKKYGASNQFIATLVDGQGNPAVNEKIIFNINGVFYNQLTDSNGKARLNIDLNPGLYIITSQYGQAVISNKIFVSEN